MRSPRTRKSFIPAPCRILACWLCVVGIGLVGCEKKGAPPSDTVRAEPKAKYQEAVAAAKELGAVIRADGDGEVTYFDFYGVRDVPATIEYVREFPNLKELNFSSTNLSDAHMEHLAGAEKLEWLALHGTQITDAGLVHIRGLKNLKILNLNDTKVGDEGLNALAGLTNLEQIRLQSTQVTDAGLDHLAPLKKLKVVWLSGSKVTSSGVDQLKQALPDAEIVSGEITPISDAPLAPASNYQQ